MKISEIHVLHTFLDGSMDCSYIEHDGTVGMMVMSDIELCHHENMGVLVFKDSGPKETR